MDYSLIADMYERIEATTKRLEITDQLVSLLKVTPRAVIDKVVYLTQGKLYPDYMGIEVGIAEKLAIRALVQASGLGEATVIKDLERTGDLGETAANLLKRRVQVTLMKEHLTVERVYETMDRIARAAGDGAQETKVRLLSSLLVDASPRDAKYIMRTVTGKLRLGLADMTILDALAVAYCGSKEERPSLERAYNLSSDLGSVARAVAEEGAKGVERFRVVVGKPIRPMLAERLPSAKEIIEKLGGRGAAEYKYDGERLQAHKAGRKVELFSRRLEKITSHYPDACELIQQHVRAKEAIIECECVAVNPETEELMPFQELMHRRRKYGIEEAMKTYPVSLFMFDVLYIDGEDLTTAPYPVRRRRLEKIVREVERVKIAKALVTSDPVELERFFEEAVSEGCEGLVVKSAAPESIYQAGARGWLWIKLKRDYQALLTDTLDLVVVGAFHGRGKRGGTYGALLMAAYDEEKDTFPTISKCGSGFTDDDLEKLPTLLKDYRIDHRHGRVESQLKADVWFIPTVILEILGAEITLSPIHLAGMDVIRRGSGLAVRFPRFTGKYRSDKAPEDATTVKEIVEIYQRQLKKITEKPAEAAV